MHISAELGCKTKVNSVLSSTESVARRYEKRVNKVKQPNPSLHRDLMATSYLFSDVIPKESKDKEKSSSCIDGI